MFSEKRNNMFCKKIIYIFRTKINNKFSKSRNNTFCKKKKSKKKKIRFSGK